MGREKPESIGALRGVDEIDRLEDLLSELRATAMVSGPKRTRTQLEQFAAFGSAGTLHCPRP
jgi:hypothetical protein